MRKPALFLLLVFYVGIVWLQSGLAIRFLFIAVG